MPLPEVIVPIPDAVIDNSPCEDGYRPDGGEFWEPSPLQFTSKWFLLVSMGMWFGVVLALLQNGFQFDREANQIIGIPLLAVVVMSVLLATVRAKIQVEKPWELSWVIRHQWLQLLSLVVGTTIVVSNYLFG